MIIQGNEGREWEKAIRANYDESVLTSLTHATFLLLCPILTEHHSNDNSRLLTDFNSPLEGLIDEFRIYFLIHLNTI